MITSFRTIGYYYESTVICTNCFDKLENHQLITDSTKGLLELEPATVDELPNGFTCDNCWLVIK